MTRINLLPWREWERQRTRQQFFYVLALAVILGIGIVFWANRISASAVANQQARNEYLHRQLAQMDRRIATIRSLKSTRDALLARMQVIEKLEQSRPTVVHLFDQLVRTAPDGLYLTSVDNRSGNLKISGVADSPAVVSTYMRQIAGSQWMGAPNLQIVRTHARGNEKSSDFTVTTKVTNPQENAGDDGKAGGR